MSTVEPATAIHPGRAALGPGVLCCLVQLCFAIGPCCPWSRYALLWGRTALGLGMLCFRAKVPLVQVRLVLTLYCSAHKARVLAQPVPAEQALPLVNDVRAALARSQAA
eukprot:1161517-Pelagomonas_calceolata.AAC.4